MYEGLLHLFVGYHSGCQGSPNFFQRAMPNQFVFVTYDPLLANKHFTIIILEIVVGW